MLNPSARRPSGFVHRAIGGPDDDGWILGILTSGGERTLTLNAIASAPLAVRAFLIAIAQETGELVDIARRT